jgi:hypothetical protein
MSNIHNVHIIVSEDGTLENGTLHPYDFSCNDGTSDIQKTVTGVYITISGTTVTEHPTNVAGSEYVTKVNNPCNGSSAYLRESPTTMSLLTGARCIDCRDIQTNPMAGDNCTTPMHTQDCDRASLLAKIQDVITAISNQQINVGDVTIDNTQVVARLDAILDIVNNTYNNEDHYRVTGSAPAAPFDTDPTDGPSKILAGGLFHSVSILIEEGVGSVLINGKKYKHRTGYTACYTGTAFLANEIVIAAESNDAVITIITTK